MTLSVFLYVFVFLKYLSSYQKKKAYVGFLSQRVLVERKLPEAVFSNRPELVFEPIRFATGEGPETLLIPI